MATTKFTSLDDTVELEKVTSFDDVMTTLENARNIFNSSSTSNFFASLVSNVKLYNADFNIQLENNNNDEVTIQIEFTLSYNDEIINTSNINITGTQQYILKTTGSGTSTTQSYDRDFTAKSSAYSYTHYAIRQEALRLANGCYAREATGKEITATGLKNSMPTTQYSITNSF